MSGHQPAKRHRRKGRRDDPPEVRLSKTLAFALRHGAQELALPMRPSGFVALDALLALPLFQGYSVQQVEAVVRSSDKRRFSLAVDEGGNAFIRANQGHSLRLVSDEALLERIEDPREIPTCIHGTYRRLWPSILETGLSRMARNHVHLTPMEAVSEAHGVVSGMRADCDLLVYVDAERAMAGGVRFFRSSNNVILSPGLGERGVIDPQYLLRAVTRDGAVVYERQESSD